jgi:transposase
MRAANRRRHSSRRPRQRGHIGKPRGILSPRVQAVGPEHFGIVAVDCAKVRSKWMLTDYYGRVLVPPTIVEHQHTAFNQALATLRQAIAEYEIEDLVVAVERTGRYHLPVLRVFTAAGYDARIVHPSISCYFREADSYDNKTDDTDLEGIYRAAINGFGLREQPWDAVYSALQFWTRCRRDLVRKTTLLHCQILEYLEACLPGYSGCFDNIFISKIALLVPRWFATPQAIVQAGLAGLTQLTRLAGVRVHRNTLIGILGWAQNAPTPDANAPLYRQLVCTLNDDRLTKEKQIQASEKELVPLLVQTPYIRLLALPGINVVLASELAAEAGPMVHYATARVITGRAGLYPRRYQSDEVDHASGALARRGNRRLRCVLLMAADTLLRCNEHFGVLGAKWADQGKDPHDIHVRIGGRFTRIAFQMVIGKEGFRHPACQGPPAVLSKLMEFHKEHDIELDMTRTNLQRAAAQLPRAEQARERVALNAQLEAARGSRGRGPKLLSAILPAVLIQLGGVAAGLIESIQSGETP